MTLTRASAGVVCGHLGGTARPAGPGTAENLIDRRPIIPPITWEFR
jgi:hypothetical protein